MNTLTLQPSRALAVLFIAEALLAFAPVAILAPAIGWPASLRNPAAQQLAAIAAQPGAVAVGYGLYLLYSMLIAAVGVGLATRWGGGLQRPWAAAAAGFMALSALARAIGILRWLTVMPLLAHAHHQAHATGDASTQTQLAVVFDAVHAWGGGIGEVLGVSLFMAFGLAAWAVAARQTQSAPAWMVVFAAIVAAMLASLSLPVWGLAAPAPVALAVTALSVWMLAAGVLAWRGR